MSTPIGFDSGEVPAKIRIMAAEVRIEPIGREDHEGLVVLFREFAEFERLSDRMVNSVERMAREAEFLTGFVAKNNIGEILGYATCFFAYYTWIGKSLYMDDLYVRPEYRGQGLGSKLIGAVIAHGRAEGCHKLRWQVFKLEHRRHRVLPSPWSANRRH
jgi:GNAT superfamily N-acetyltransferase